MQNNSRIKNSAFNLTSSLIGKALTILLNFVVRSIFIHCLDEAYLSVNGLYSNILTVLSLAELGFGTAMVFRMYEPIAKKDYDKAAALLKYYKKIYICIGCVILLLGLCVIPFMDYIIKDKPDIPYLTVYYLMFLFNTVVSYWFSSYKASVFFADQKEYIKTNVQNISSLVQAIIQVILLLSFKKYFLYLLTQIAANIFTNLYVAHLANKKYPQIIHNKKYLAKEDKHQILKDTQALVLSRVGHVVLNGTDNIIISAVVGVLWVGKLANYTLISDSVTGILCQITAAITGSLGNYFATESKKNSYSLFKKVEFLNFWLYGFSFVALVVLLDPFIRIWAGEKFVLGLPISIAIAINFFVAGYMNTLWTFRSTLGLFKQGKYRPLVVSFINIPLSVLLGKYLGVFGVLFATFIARASINIWYDPLILHKYGFNTSVKPFYYRYIKRISLMVAITLFLLILRNLIIPNNEINIFRFISMVFITAIVPNFIFWICFKKNEEFKFYKDMVFKRILIPIRKKIVRRK